MNKVLLTGFFLALLLVESQSFAQECISDTELIGTWKMLKLRPDLSTSDANVPGQAHAPDGRAGGEKEGDTPPPERESTPTLTELLEALQSGQTDPTVLVSKTQRASRLATFGSDGTLTVISSEAAEYSGETTDLEILGKWSLDCRELTHKMTRLAKTDIRGNIDAKEKQARKKAFEELAKDEKFRQPSVASLVYLEDGYAVMKGHDLVTVLERQ